MIPFQEQQRLNKRRAEYLRYKSQAQKFVASGGLLAKGQNVFINRPVLVDNRNYKLVEVDKTKARLGRLRHRVWSWAEAMKPVNGKYDLYMVTLTYKNIEDWKPGHIRDFMLKLRKRFPYIVSYAWVAELQRRGAVHYHIMVGVPLQHSFYDRTIGFPDALGDWTHGMSRIDKARTEFYIVTYSGKEYQKMGRFPKGLRMFAVWISNKVLSKIQLYKFSLSSKPKWLSEIVIESRDIFEAMMKLKRSPGGGWDIGNMISLPSPYSLVRL